MANHKRAAKGSVARSRAIGSPYTPTGHPSIEQLMAEQGTSAIADPRVLLGDFWPEDEPIEDFLQALDEWRGHRRDQAA